MVKLTVTKKGKINKEHGHDWDKFVGKISSILAKNDNAFHNIAYKEKFPIYEETK